MKKFLYLGIACVGASLAATCLPLEQVPKVAGDTKTESARPANPRQPGGKLSHQIGVYRTIEGIQLVGGKVETGTLLVDTVDGEKLDKPIPLLVRGAVVINQNLEESTLELPANRRCVFKGFETGGMIGVPPAVASVAQEQGWTEVPMSAAVFQWRPYFVALLAVEPKGFELRKR